MDYSNERRERHSYPSEEVIMVRGEAWTRTHRMHCPVCGHTFYSWEPQERPGVPGTSDPEPEIIDGVHQGVRRTCGSVYCEQAEDRHQLTRGHAYQKARDDYHLSRQSTTNAEKKAESKGFKRLGQ